MLVTLNDRRVGECNLRCILHEMTRSEGNLVHSATQSVSTLDQCHVKTMLQENIGTAQPRESSTDNTDTRQATKDLRSALMKT